MSETKNELLHLARDVAARELKCWVLSKLRGAAWGVSVAHYFRIKIIKCSTVYSIKAVLLVPTAVPGMQQSFDTYLKNEQMNEYCL